MMKNWVS